MRMRKSDWPELLAREVEAAAERPFCWGKHDCCLFAANIVKAMTGDDPAKAFRGRYRTEFGARRALKRYGSGTLYHTLRSLFGNPIPPARAWRGDLVYMVTENGPSAGVCLGAIAAFASDGLAFVPMSETAKAWRVGHG
ncbi:MAG: hypothetical protein ACE5EM_12670 [Sphingomonadales bacterium]